jgi:hypothetical protein
LSGVADLCRSDAVTAVVGALRFVINGPELLTGFSVLGLR